VIPVVFFENSWVQLMGPFLELRTPSLKWGNEQELSFGVGAQLIGFNGYEPDDAPILNGMAERKSGIFAGPFVKWSSPLFNVSAQWMLDASRKSKGQRISLGLERSFHVGEHFMLTPSAVATWMDGKYADYYFGVRSEEARAGRPTYVAKSTLNAELGLRIDYLIDKRHSVFAALQYNALGSAITKSPLVDASSEQGILLGYLFRFR
jgi:outer membrane protein